MQDRNFQLKAADAINTGDFTNTPMGALMFRAMTGDAAGYVKLDGELTIIGTQIVSMLNLAADSMETGEAVDEMRTAQITDVLRLAASLAGFCVSAREVYSEALSAAYETTEKTR